MYVYVNIRVYTRLCIVKDTHTYRVKTCSASWMRRLQTQINCVYLTSGVCTSIYWPRRRPRRPVRTTSTLYITRTERATKPILHNPQKAPVRSPLSLSIQILNWLEIENWNQSHRYIYRCGIAESFALNSTYLAVDLPLRLSDYPQVNLKSAKLLPPRLILISSLLVANGLSSRQFLIAISPLQKGSVFDYIYSVLAIASLACTGAECTGKLDAIPFYGHLRLYACRSRGI